MKERFWPAVAGAFAMHSLAISALAFGLIHTNSSRSQSVQDNFCVEMVFHQEDQAAPLEADGAEQSTDALQEAHKASEDEAPVATAISAKRSSTKSTHKRSPKGNQASPSLVSPTVGSSSGATSPFPLFNPPPPYPREARLRKIEGVVMVRVSLSEEGAVADAKPLSPRVDPILEGAALKAIRQWKFKPGITTLEVPIEFKLET
jgi:protein TonB